MKVGYGSHRTFYDWISLFSTYRRFVRESDTVLEIGASSEERTHELAGHCKQVIGIELFPDRVPDDVGNIHYQVEDWQTLSRSVKPESIDLAVASHVIEHVPDDLVAINELHKVLNPAGIGLLNTPNRKRLPRAVIETFGGERVFPWWEHIREYTEDDMGALLDSSRFSRWEIVPVTLGLHGGRLFIYAERVPGKLRKYANFWEVHLFKGKE